MDGTSGRTTGSSRPASSSQLVPRVGVDVGYFRRWYGNFAVTDNLATAPSDYTQYSITAPVDPRLPNGGGYVVSGLYNLNPNKVGQINNLFTLASNYGNYIEHWNGVDVNLNVRLAAGAVLQGGMSTGSSSLDVCDLRANLPELVVVSTAALGTAPYGVSPTSPLCHVDGKFLTQVKFLGTYAVPKVDVQIAATFRSLPGPSYTANYIATNAVVQPSLGRPLSGGAANVDGESRRSRAVVRRADKPARSALLEDLQIRKIPDVPESRFVQCVEFERDHVGQQQLCGLADADRHSPGPLLQDQRKFRLLISGASAPAGGALGF